MQTVVVVPVQSLSLLLIGSFCLPLFSVLYLSVDKTCVPSIRSVIELSGCLKGKVCCFSFLICCSLDLTGATVVADFFLKGVCLSTFLYHCTIVH